MSTNTQKQKKNVGYRLLALLFIALSVVALILPVKVFKTASAGLELQDLSIINAIKEALGSEYSPFLTGNLLAGVAIYVIALVAALNVILGLIALFSGKKAPGLARAMAFISTWGFAIYAASIVLGSSYAGNLEVTFDVITLALAVVSAFFYFILALAKNGKAVWIETLQTFLVVAYSAAIILAISHKGSAVVSAVKENFIGKILLIAILAWVVFNLFVGALRLMSAKGIRGSIVRYILSMVFALLCCVVFILCKLDSASFHIFSIVAAVIALLQIILAIAQLKKAHKQALVEKEESIHKSFRVEEYAEAYVYEGGPVAGITMATEVKPSDLSVDMLPKKAETAGYDFFNCKSFDPFIAILDNEERKQFTELFILKWKGIMPEIPDYVVGGDNDEFFRKLFIYLGQYRDRIPDSLLAKIYQFAIKMS